MQTKHKWFKQKCISKEKEKIEMVEEKLSFHKNWDFKKINWDLKNMEEEQTF